MMDLSNYYYFEEIGSTNEQAKLFAKDKYPEGTIVSAGRQTAGKGRVGRKWESPQGESISTSMVLYPKVAIEHVSTITLVAAMAVTRAVEEVLHRMLIRRYDSCYAQELLNKMRPTIKWPNDVVLKNKKICGILTEMSATNNQVDNVIVGIGVNVHNQTFPEELIDKAIAIDRVIEEETGIPMAESKNHVSRKELNEEIWRQFAICYEEYLKTEDMTGCITEYNAHLANLNAEVRVLDPLEPFEGIARGINPRGELIVETAQGIREVSSGEVSVRGMYTYV